MTSDTPFISVIIPAFDEERCLPATLQAVENSALLLRSQDGVNTEVIVVDNNSADATAEVARSLRARVIAASEHNIARVRNCGAEKIQVKRTTEIVRLSGDPGAGCVHLRKPYSFSGKFLICAR